MPAKNPRINIVLEKPLYSAIHDLAENEGLSMSMLVRDLIKESLELREDLALADLASAREKSFNRVKTLTHEQAWS